jgi:hypothetical protein
VDVAVHKARQYGLVFVSKLRDSRPLRRNDIFLRANSAYSVTLYQDCAALNRRAAQTIDDTGCFDQLEFVTGCDDVPSLSCFPNVQRLDRAVRPIPAAASSAL